MTAPPEIDRRELLRLTRDRLDRDCIFYPSVARRFVEARGRQQAWQFDLRTLPLVTEPATAIARKSLLLCRFKKRAAGPRRSDRTSR